MMSEVKQIKKNVYKYRLIISFSMFFIFFTFYMWVAIINTPPFKNFASTIVAGMPLGMFTSLLIFPVSWLIVVIYFILWR